MGVHTRYWSSAGPALWALKRPKVSLPSRLRRTNSRFKSLAAVMILLSLYRRQGYCKQPAKPRCSPWQKWSGIEWLQGQGSRGLESGVMEASCYPGSRGTDFEFLWPFHRSWMENSKLLDRLMTLIHRCAPLGRTAVTPARRGVARRRTCLRCCERLPANAQRKPACST